MPISSSSNRGFPLPGATTTDRRLADMQAVKSALTAIDVDLANSQASAVQTTSIGIANGVAGLDAQGNVPASQLPSYVDDVLEFANLVGLPVTGLAGVIYVTLDDNKVYRWSGATYIEILSSPGSTDSVAEGSVNKYYTAARVLADAPVSSVAGRTGDVTLTPADVPGVATKVNELVSQNANYTCVLADSGKIVLHPSTDTAARTFTLPSNAAVPFPVGTAITFVNHNGAGVVTISITTDTMRLAGTGAAGDRTLAANGACTALKLTATEWLISGTGVS